MNKLEVLNKFLNHLENLGEDDYKWVNYKKCNCGQLLKTIGYEEVSIENLITQLDKYPVLLDGDYIYTSYFSFYLKKRNLCNITKLPFDEVINQLVSYKFTLQELVDLEMLADKRFRTEDTMYNSLSSLIEYVKNWIKYEELLVKNIKETVQQSVGM